MDFDFLYARLLYFHLSCLTQKFASNFCKCASESCPLRQVHSLFLSLCHVMPFAVPPTSLLTACLLFRFLSLQTTPILHSESTPGGYEASHWLSESSVQQGIVRLINTTFFGSIHLPLTIYLLTSISNFRFVYKIIHPLTLKTDKQQNKKAYAYAYAYVKS